MAQQETSASSAVEKTRKPQVNFTNGVKARFLEALRSSGNVRAACQAVGIDRNTAYNHRNKYPTFAKDWDNAVQDAIDVIEAKGMQKAANGKSDLLTIFFLKAHRRDLYGDRQVIAGDKENPVVFEDARRQLLDRVNNRSVGGRPAGSGDEPAGEDGGGTPV